MNETKSHKIQLKSFLASSIVTFMVFSFVQNVRAFFSDIKEAQETAAIMSATLDIDILDFQIKDGSGNWSTALTDWMPYGVTELRFTVENVGYDDVVLIDTLKMSWGDTTLDPSVLVLYPASMSDADIVADITSVSPTSAIYGTTGTDAGQPYITFVLNDGRLNGLQSSVTAADKTKTISYKLVLNHDTDAAYEDKNVSIALSSLAKYYYDPAIAWDSSKENLTPVTITTAVSTGALFEVVFNANGGSGTPSSLRYRSDFGTSHTFTIPTTAPVYDLNHIFTGWNANSVATTAAYQPGDTITVNAGTTTLYAIYKNPFTIAYENAGKTMSNNYFVMQDMSTAICDAVTTPTILTDAPATQLVDSRDNKIYWVAKLADGKCWMTQNLDYDLNTRTVLTNATSDLNSVTSWTPSANTIDATSNATTTGRGTTVSWRGSATSAISIDVGNVYYIYDPAANAICPTDGYLSSTCPAVFSATPSANKGEHGHVGNYYDFPAAVAHSSVRSNQTYIDSVCPAHWRISYSTGSDDYATLASAYGANGYDDPLLEAPVYFTRAGYMYNNHLMNAGGTGQMWTAKINQNVNNKTTGFQHTASMAETRNELAPGNGATVRCIAR